MTCACCDAEGATRPVDIVPGAYVCEDAAKCIDRLRGGPRRKGKRG